MRRTGVTCYHLLTWRGLDNWENHRPCVSCMKCGSEMERLLLSIRFHEFNSIDGLQRTQMRYLCVNEMVFSVHDSGFSMILYLLSISISYAWLRIRQNCWVWNPWCSKNLSKGLRFLISVPFKGLTCTVYWSLWSGHISLHVILDISSPRLTITM